MEHRIILETLRWLEELGTQRRLVELHLTRFFTTVRLDDDSVGVCMSYYSLLSDDVLRILERRLARHCSNPISVKDVEGIKAIVAEHVADERQRCYLVASLMAGVTSALSAPLIRSGGDEWFEVKPHLPENWLNGAETALVVGFGGYLKHLVHQRDLKKVHVIDFSYESSGKSSMWQAQIAEWSAQHTTKSVIGSNGLTNTFHLREFDLICITGSTLCNGTLEYFLTNVRRDATVVLQGPSASLHPKILFKAGVKWVSTIMTPSILGQLCRGRHDGEEMRPMLEDGLPYIHLFPRL